MRLFILSQNEERFDGDPSIYFYQICLVIYHIGCHIRAISAVKRPICLDQQMHVDSFAKFFETLNCYIKKKIMKWNTGIIVKYLPLLEVNLTINLCAIMLLLCTIGVLYFLMVWRAYKCILSLSQFICLLFYFKMS